MIKYLNFITLFFIHGVALAQVDHWESVVLEGQEWTYLIPTEEPGTDWTLPDFNDSDWQVGPSGIGYGDGDDNTNIASTMSVYLRKEFTIVDLEAIEEVILHMDYDDGFVAYINGVEVARDLLSGQPPAFDQATDGLHEAQLYRGFLPAQFSLSKDLLQQGQNQMAVQVHNQGLGSSDLSAIPFLSLGINDNSRNYSPVPDWFQEPVGFTSSSFPIILIETQGSQIVNEPRVTASMKVIKRPDGTRNAVSDQDNPDFLEFDGAIRIEIRGSTSSLLPKKPYALTTYDQFDINKENVSLLGMPTENDWVLNGLAYDPSLIRDYLSYYLSRQLGEYAPRTAYCELMIDGTYQGLYMLQESIKQDNNRVDINSIEIEDQELPQLSGGYITKSDKVNESDPEAWRMPNYSGWSTTFIHEIPKPENVTSNQQEYIKGEFTRLAQTTRIHDASLTEGYPSIIDFESFIHFMIISELSSNPDAYQFSTYFHKDRNAKLRAGPLWDLNLSYGNDLFFPPFNYDRSKTDLWQFFDGENVGATFWKDLFDSPDFRCQLSKRWNELIQPGQPLNLDVLEARIDEVVDSLDEVIPRENAAWGTINDHPGEIANMKIWLNERITWLTANLGPYASCENPNLPELVISAIHYHPQDGSEYEFIELTNVGNDSIDLTGIYFGGTGLVYQFPAGVKLEPAGTFVLANEADDFQYQYAFAPDDEFSRSLANGGQAIRVLDAFGNVIDEVDYDDEAPWPSEADGEGPYLRLLDLNSDNNDPSNWRAESYSNFILSSEEESVLLSVYPNPADLSLKLSSNHQIDYLLIRDLNGKLIMKTEVKADSYEVNTSTLSPGIYTIEIITPSKSYFRKVGIK